METHVPSTVKSLQHMCAIHCSVMQMHDKHLSTTSPSAATSCGRKNIPQKTPECINKILWWTQDRHDSACSTTFPSLNQKLVKQVGDVIFELLNGPSVSARFISGIYPDPAKGCLEYPCKDSDASKAGVE